MAAVVIIKVRGSKRRRRTWKRLLSAGKRHPRVMRPKRKEAPHV